MRTVSATADGLTQISARIEELSDFLADCEARRNSSPRLGDRAVALIVKRTLGHAGFSPEESCDHSLRAGLAALAVERGQHKGNIMPQAQHKET